MRMFAKFVAFDLETTGLEEDSNEIIEIGAVKFTVEENKGSVVPKILKIFQTLVKPEMLIPESATKVNGITDKMVENAPKISDALKKFTEFCGQDSVLIAHNANFDAGFLRLAYNKNTQLIPGNPIIDSVKMFKTVLPTLPDYKLGNIAALFQRENLINMHVDYGDMHRAVYDCKMLMEVLVLILRRRMKVADWEMGNIMKVLAKFGGVPQFLRNVK